MDVLKRLDQIGVEDGELSKYYSTLETARRLLRVHGEYLTPKPHRFKIIERFRKALGDNRRSYYKLEREVKLGRGTGSGQSEESKSIRVYLHCPAEEDRGVDESEYTFVTISHRDIDLSYILSPNPDDSLVEAERGDNFVYRKRGWRETLELGEVFGWLEERFERDSMDKWNAVRMGGNLPD